MPRKGSAATTRLRKVECDGCGCIARMSRKALGASGAPFCGCGAGRMTLADLEDAVAVLPEDQLAEHPDYCAEREAEARKALRENRTTGKRFACGGCSKFIPDPRHHCRCGFANHPHGGRWVEGSARCAEWEREQAANDAIPF